MLPRRFIQTLKAFCLMGGLSFPAYGLPGLTDRFDTGQFLIGAGMEFLVPDELPGFQTPQMVLGPRLSVPIGRDHAEFQVGYSSGSGDIAHPKELYLVDVHYRLNLEMPYLTGFLSAGAHFTYYRGSSDLTEEKFGPTVGLGLVFPMDKDFSMGVEMRNFFLDKSMWAFGGSFEFAL